MGMCICNYMHVNVFHACSVRAVLVARHVYI